MNTQEFIEAVLAKLDSIEQKLTRIEKIKSAQQQDEHGCGKDEHWDEERQQCVPDYPCNVGEHWDREKGRCVPNNPHRKTESEGLTGMPQVETPDYNATEELQKQWQKEDEERERMSEVTTVTES